MPGKPLFMESTEIDALKTAGEIQSFLVQAGANKIMMSYANGEISGMHFVLPVNGSDWPFQLPVRVDPIFKIMNGRRKYQSDRVANTARDREQAKRVAWRQLYRWVQAQLAMIQTGMVDAAEVFMPYVQTGVNETMYQRALSGGLPLMLQEGKAEPQCQ